MMREAENNKTVTVTLDGRQVEAMAGETVFALAQRFGIEIPALCQHQDLEPVGACRLCLVEVVKGGRTRVVTSCNYPVFAGLEVVTSSPLLSRNRRLTMEALLARCPGVEPIRELAAQLGVTSSRLPEGDDDCILCGLCTRVCQTYATSAIATLERGLAKRVGFFGDESPDECVGCLACAEICPTGCIPASRDDENIKIWNRTFPLAICKVDEEKCQGCGLCEQACPFAVARISLRRDGSAPAVIEAAACKGCGVCLAACPTGAISQPEAARPEAGGERLLVVSCGRAHLRGPFATALPAGVDVLELPCTGGVTVSRILAELAAGRDGVLILGRHEDTCRLQGAEKQAQLTAGKADRLARLVGLGMDRVSFVQPAPGSNGPLTAVIEFMAGLPPTPLTGKRTGSWEDSLPGAVELITWLSGRAELNVDGRFWLAEKGLPVAAAGAEALLVYGLPYMDILFGDDLLPLRPVDLVEQGLAVLAARGITAGVVVDGLVPGEIARDNGQTYYSLCSACATQLKAEGFAGSTIDEIILASPPTGAGEKIAVDISQSWLVDLVKACGAEPVDAGPEVLGGQRFPDSGDAARAIEKRLAKAAAGGASMLLVASLPELLQHQYCCREGAWQRTLVQPVAAVTLAAILDARGGRIKNEK